MTFFSLLAPSIMVLFRTKVAERSHASTTPLITPGQPLPVSFLCSKTNFPRAHSSSLLFFTFSSSQVIEQPKVLNMLNNLRYLASLAELSNRFSPPCQTLCQTITLILLMMINWVKQLPNIHFSPGFIKLSGVTSESSRTCIPAPWLTWILHRQLRLLGYGSGKPGDSIVPRRSVKLPLQGTGRDSMKYKFLGQSLLTTQPADRLGCQNQAWDNSNRALQGAKDGNYNG